MENTAQHACLGRSVLIVDDEQGIRELFVAILEQDIPRVALDQAANGVEALDQFREGQHRVLIMDLHMPVMDGLTAFGRISRLCEETTLDMPAVVFCTGYAPPDSVRRIVKACSRHHLLCKPVPSETLVNVIRSRLY